MHKRPHHKEGNFDSRHSPSPYFLKKLIQHLTTQKASLDLVQMTYWDVYTKTTAYDKICLAVTYLC